MFQIACCSKRITPEVADEFSETIGIRTSGIDEFVCRGMEHKQKFLRYHVKDKTKKT